jgi:hypothetical protein
MFPEMDYSNSATCSNDYRGWKTPSVNWRHPGTDVKNHQFHLYWRNPFSLFIPRDVDSVGSEICWIQSNNIKLSAPFAFFFLSISCPGSQLKHRKPQVAKHQHVWQTPVLWSYEVANDKNLHNAEELNHSTSNTEDPVSSFAVTARKRAAANQPDTSVWFVLIQ